MKVNIHLGGSNSVQIKDDSGNRLKEMQILELANILNAPVAITFLPHVISIEYDGKNITFIDDQGKSTVVEKQWDLGNTILQTFANLATPTQTVSTTMLDNFS